MSFSDILYGSTVLTVLVVVFVLSFVCNWKIFVKMGEPGWKCLIPFYNLYIQSKHCWTTAGFVVLLILELVVGLLPAFVTTTMDVAFSIIVIIVAIATLVMRIAYYYYTSKAFGKGVGMTLLLWLFPFIGELVLGFGSSEYEGNKAVK